MRLPSIAAIADEIKMRRSGVTNVLGALCITFKPSLSNEFFPEKFEEVPPVEGVHQVPHHRLHCDYAEHLLEVMKLASDSLNAFLFTSGSQ